jgi:hypothetical protein
MVTWSGFIAKVVELLISKVVGKKIDLALDDRKKAARTFLRLHHLLNELEAITREIRSNIDNPNRDYPRMRGAWIHEIDERVANLSNDFFRLSDDLDMVLSFFDPVLQKALANLAYSKFSLLVCASHGWHSAAVDLPKSIEVTYTYPDERLMSIDLEFHYQWLLQNKEPKLDSLDWPQSVLIGIEQDEMIREDSIPCDPGESRLIRIAELRRVLDIHLTLLTEANAALRAFIGKTFRIEDVLA